MSEVQAVVEAPSLEGKEPIAQEVDAVSSNKAPGKSTKVTSTGVTADSKYVAPPLEKKTKPGSPIEGETKEIEEPTPAEKRKYKLKVDGQDLEEELSDDEITVRLQKARAADKRMQQAAQTQKQFQDIVEWIKKDPFEALKHEAFGLDLNKLAEERLAQQYQEAILPPEEREKMQLQKELEQYKQREVQVKQQQEAKAAEQYEARVLQELETEMVSALDTSGMPKTPQTLYMMAQIAKANLNYGIELTPQQLAAEVRSNMAVTNKAVLSQLKGKALLEYLGPDVVKDVIRTRLENTKLQATQVKAPPVKRPEPQAPKKQEFMSSAQFRRKHIFGIE
jgi:hypothetical protein